MGTLDRLWDRIKEEPVVFIQLLQVLLGLSISFGIVSFTDNQVAAILAAVSAALGFVVSLAVRSFTWPVLTGVVQAAVALLLEFGVDLTDQQVGSVYAVVAALGAFFVRKATTPEVKLPALAEKQSAAG